MQHSYDPNGNRLSFLDNGETKTYTYQASSNRLTQIGHKEVVLDAAGNTVSKDNGKWKYEYGQSGRLLKVYKEKKQVATYLYDHRGLRTQKTTKHGTTIYHHDMAGKLLAETTDKGTLVRAYVWLDDMPIAQIDVKGHHDDKGKNKHRNKAKEHIAYLHTDHLGTPRLATDSSQNVVWRWDSDAFENKKPDDLDDEYEDDNKTTVNLRHSRGYADKESKLVYVWNRYLDTETGRWLTSDPIGLRGGLNTYAFVFNNPLRWIDPTGLAVLGDPMSQTNGAAVMCSARNPRDCKLILEIDLGTPILQGCYDTCGDGKHVNCCQAIRGYIRIYSCWPYLEHQPPACKCDASTTPRG